MIKFVEALKTKSILLVMGAQTHLHCLCFKTYQLYILTKLPFLTAALRKLLFPVSVSTEKVIR